MSSTLQFRVAADYEQVQRLTSEIARLEQTLRNFQPGQSREQLQAISNQLQTASQQFKQITRSAAEAGAKIDLGVKQGVNSAIAQVQSLQSQISNNPLQLAVNIAGLTAIGGFLNDLMKTRQEFQLMETNINTLVGERRGAILNAQLKEFAKVSPLDFQGTVGGAQMMLGFGIEAEQVPKFLSAIGDVAMGDRQKFNSLTLAFSQMSAAGKLMGQDLMQMVNAGFQPLDQMAKDTGKSIGQLKEEMSNGKISAKMVQDAFINATSEGGKYYQMSAKASETLGGQMSMLEDATSLMFNDMGESWEGFFMKVIEWATWIVENWKMVGSAVAGAVGAFGAFKAVKMAMDYGEKAAAEEKTKAVVDGFNRQMAAMEQYEAAKRANAAVDSMNDIQRPDDAIAKLSSGEALSDKELEQISAYSAQVEQLRLKKEKQDEINRALQDEIDKRRQITAQMNGTPVNADGIQDTLQSDKPTYDADLAKAMESGAIDDKMAEQVQKEREFMAFQSEYAKMEVDEAQKKLDKANEYLAVQERIRDEKQAQRDAAIADVDTYTDENAVSLWHGEDSGFDAVSERAAASENELADAINRVSEAKAAAEEAENNLISARETSAEIDGQIAEVQEKILAAMEESTAATESKTASQANNTEASNINTATQESNTAATQSNAVAVNAGAAAVVADTAAESANSVATNANTGATTKNSVAMVFSAAKTKFLTACTNAKTAATKAATKAWDGFTASLSANPFGVILAVLPMVLGAIGMFKSSVDETAKANEKTREDAAKTRDEISLLYHALENNSKSSRSYQEAVSGLSKYMKDFNITLNAENDICAELIKNREKLIELINADTQARIANANLSDANTRRGDAAKAFKESMADNIDRWFGGNSDRVTAIKEDYASLQLESLEENKEKIKSLVEEVEKLKDDRDNGVGQKLGEYADQFENRMNGIIAAKKAEINQLINRKAAIAAKSLGETVNLDARDTYDAAKEYNDKVFKSEDLYASQKKMADAADIRMRAQQNELKKWSTATSKDVIDKLKSVSKAMDDIKKKKIKPQIDSLEIKTAKESADEAVKNVGALDKSSASPVVQAQSLHDALDASTKLASKGTEIDMISATPYINTKHIDVALSKMGDLLLEFAKVDGRLAQYAMSDSDRARLGIWQNKYGTLDPSKWKAAGAKLLKDTGNQVYDPKQVERDIWSFAQVQKRAYANSTAVIGGKTYNLTPELAAVKMSNRDNYVKDAKGNIRLTKNSSFKTLAEAKAADDYYNRVVLMNQSQRSAEDSKYLVKLYEGSIDKANNNTELDVLISELKKGVNDANYNTDERKYFKSLLEKAEKKKTKNNPSKKNGQSKSKKQYEFEKNQRIEEEQRRQAELLRNRDYDMQTLAISKTRDQDERARMEAALKLQKDKDSVQSEIDEEARRLESDALKEWKAEMQKKGKKPKEYEDYLFYEGKDMQAMRDEYRKVAAINVGADTKTQQAEFDYSESIEKANEERADSYIQMLKTFEDVNTRILAMEKDYGRQIERAKKEGSQYDIERLKAERERERKTLQSEQLMDGLDFDTIFSDLSRYTDEYLITLQTRLTDILNDHSLNVSLEDKNRILDKLQEINGQITIKTEEKESRQWFSGMRDGGQGMWSIAKAMRDEDKRQEAVKNAKAELANREAYKAETDKALEQAGLDLREIGVASGLKAEDISVMDDSTIAKIQQSAADNPMLAQKLEAFGKAKDAAATAMQGVQSAQGAVSSAQSGGGGAGAFAVTDAIIHGVNQNMQSMVELMDELQLSNTKFGKGMKSFAESSQYATKAFDSLKSGDFVGVVSNLHGALRTLGDALGQWGIGGGLFGSSFVDFEERMAELKRSVDALRKSNELLQKEYENASVSKTMKTTEKELKNYRKELKETKQLMAAGAAAYNNGFIGIGGKSSGNREIVKRLDDLSGTETLSNGLRTMSDIVGARVTKDNFLSYFWSLTPEQMAQLLQDSPLFFSEVQNALTKGDKDVSEMLDNYVALAKKEEEILNHNRELITGTSYDSIISEFKSMLADVNSTAADFADSFQKMMQNAVINGLINDKYAARIKKWYANFSDSMTSGGKLTAAEQERLRKEYNDMVEQGIKERDALFETMDWNGSASQRAGARSVQGMSEDTGNAIEGRMTAIHLSVESIRKNAGVQATSLASVSNAMLQSMMERNHYREFYDGVSEKVARIYTELQCINDNTAVMAKLMAPMQRDIEQIQKNTKRI